MAKKRTFPPPKKNKAKKKPISPTTPNNENASPPHNARNSQANNTNNSTQPLPLVSAPNNAPPLPPRGIPLTPQTAIRGRIVWIPLLPTDSMARKYGCSKGADRHPAVIVFVDRPPPLAASEPAWRPTVQLLPITSFGGQTAEEKWSVGAGGRALRRFYRLIVANEGCGGCQQEEAQMREAGVKELRLRDGQCMRTRSYISLRDDKIKIEVGMLDLYTSEGGDAGIFLEEECAKNLLEDHRSLTWEKLSR